MDKTLIQALDAMIRAGGATTAGRPMRRTAAMTEPPTARASHAVVEAAEPRRLERLRTKVATGAARDEEASAAAVRGMAPREEPRLSEYERSLLARAGGERPEV